MNYYLEDRLQSKEGQRQTDEQMNPVIELIKFICVVVIQVESRNVYKVFLCGCAGTLLGEL